LLSTSQSALLPEPPLLPLLAWLTERLNTSSRLLPLLLLLMH
jgi:hypothetical protein